MQKVVNRLIILLEFHVEPAHMVVEHCAFRMVPQLIHTENDSILGLSFFSEVLANIIEKSIKPLIGGTITVFFVRH